MRWFARPGSHAKGRGEIDMASVTGAQPIARSPDGKTHTFSRGERGHDRRQHRFVTEPAAAEPVDLERGSAASAALGAWHLKRTLFAVGIAVQFEPLSGRCWIPHLLIECTYDQTLRT